MTGKRAVETGGQGEPLQGSLSWVQGRGGGRSVPGTQGGHGPVSRQVLGQLQPSIRLGRPLHHNICGLSHLGPPGGSDSKGEKMPGEVVSSP